jgi:hypothetical protein
MQSDEGGAHGDLGLAKADVSADQTVHRLAGGEVLQHGADRRSLVGGLLEAETLGEGGVVVCRKREGAPWRAAR